MADLQTGMIYLKIRTSRKMQEVSSTFQLDVMNKVKVNFKVNFGHAKIFESLQVCGQTGNCPAQSVFGQIQKRHMNLTESLEKLGIIIGTSERYRTDSSVREKTTLTRPHQTHSSLDKQGRG